MDVGELTDCTMFAITVTLIVTVTDTFINLITMFHAVTLTDMVPHPNKHINTNTHTHSHTHR